jgi:hypothetical protein
LLLLEVLLLLLHGCLAPLRAHLHPLSGPPSPSQESNTKPAALCDGVSQQGGTDFRNALQRCKGRSTYSLFKPILMP